MLTDDLEDSLLNVPLGNIQPGALSCVFAARAHIEARKHEEELEHKQEAIQAVRKEHDRDEESAQDELHRREHDILQQLEERERQIRVDAEELDRRTIKLADGKRAYVDGNAYRDAEGHELHGAERAEAEVLHVDQPHAATWQEEQSIKQRWSAAESVRREIEVAQSGDPSNATAALDTATEKLSRIPNPQATATALPNYGTGDYMSELSGIAVPKPMSPGS